jgi:hyperosmotically inducible protein
MFRRVRRGGSAARQSTRFAAPAEAAARGCNFSFDSLQENFMKHLVNVVSAVFVAALALTAVGCASTPQTEGTGEYVDDSVITGKVKAAILNEPSLKVAEINVETFKGVVQLSGFVSSQAAITKAVEVTRGVGGVKSVKNDMRIK